VVVSISDTGPGIAADDIPKLFREFSQIHAQDMGEDAGSGLGLAITKELVELHGGSIWVDSVLGEGTTFCFSLPVPRSQPVTPRMVKTSATGRRSMIPTCIIVHDDPDIIRLFGRYLTGYRVAGLPSEVDLARLANQLRPSAIITNSTRIPAVSARIDELPFDIPLIGCQIPHLYETHHSGSILGYLVKPVAPELLTAILGRLDHHNDTTVLIVDDDADAVRLLERMLTALPNPYRISKAYDGNQALELMRESPPRILMLDFVMPNLSGEEVLRQMQADESLRDIPVVIISGQDWINPGLTLGNAIHMECREPLSLTGGLECMQAILNTLGPNALHAPAAFQPSQEGAPEEQAFAVQHQLPEPEPGEVDPGPNRSQ
jgi:DNA-binding NarL/FixJ family response regulator